MTRHILTAELKAKLHSRGVESLHTPGYTSFPHNCMFEAPCSIKWMELHGRLHLGSFSYAVSGYYNDVSFGRYVSVGEEVQMGRGDHSTNWLSTAPSFYLHQKLFDVGSDFNGSGEFDAFRPNIAGSQGFVMGSTITIENDVWIGHRAYIRPGVKIGTGAIIGAYAVVTRDVPPYAIVVGNPGRIVRYRFPEELIGRLLACQWWTLAPWQLRGIDLSRPEKSIDNLENRVAGTQPFEASVIQLAELV